MGFHRLSVSLSVLVGCAVPAFALDLAALDGNVPRYAVVGDNSKGMSDGWRWHDVGSFVPNPDIQVQLRSGRFAKGAARPYRTFWTSVSLNSRRSEKTWR